jgi:hypothetical protein
MVSLVGTNFCNSLNPGGGKVYPIVMRTHVAVKCQRFVSTIMPRCLDLSESWAEHTAILYSGYKIKALNHGGMLSYDPIPSVHTNFSQTLISHEPDNSRLGTSAFLAY